MSFLAVKGLHKHYGQVSALRDINLEVARGEFVTFLGPSGCGKTTLLRAIAGLDAQSSGSVWLESRDISCEPPERRGFGIVFQSYALFPNLTVGDNIAYGLVSQGWSREQRRQRVGELLDLVGLTGFESKYPAQCSGGQQQRVALARALAPRPSLLLLDEPLSALDAQVRVRLRSQIKRLQEQLGVTTIMVTHDQEEALTMANRVVVMNRGVIEQVGVPQEIYRRPANRFVAEFVGAMNFFAATVLSPDRLSLSGAELPLAESCALPVGSAVTAAIRPEHLTLAASEAGGVAAQLIEREFLGSQVRIWLRLSDGSEAQAVLAPEALRNLPADGALVQLSLPADCLRLYPAEAA